MVKVLLVNPPFTIYGGLKGHGGKTPPINLTYLASYLREKGVSQPSILDAEALNLEYSRIEAYIRDYLFYCCGSLCS
jgi:hypothetical protein